MQRRLCEMSEAKWSITEAKCLQISHNKYASQRDAISHSMGNLMLSHSAGMHNTDKSIAGISKRFHFASLHYIFSAYLPTHIKFLTEFHRIFFGTTRISFPKEKQKEIGLAEKHKPHTIREIYHPQKKSGLPHHQAVPIFFGNDIQVAPKKMR